MKSTRNRQTKNSGSTGKLYVRQLLEAFCLNRAASKSCARNLRLSRTSLFHAVSKNIIFEEDKSENDLTVQDEKHPNWLEYERAFQTISIHISEHAYLQQHSQCNAKYNI